ncbi:hypothetical protein IW147_001489 [Coemansia sp. RSA 720]|nr:hypothetical protein IW147_001489 [Coemansia sp. RSA 720]
MIAKSRRAFTASRLQCVHYAHKAPTSMTRDESAAIRDFQTTSSPSTRATQPACIAALRHRAQCSPWVLQLTSGLRTDMLTGTPSTQDLLVRIKPKLMRDPPAPSMTRMLTIDELESFSSSSGKSRYVSLSARGMHAFATDAMLQKMLKGEGWMRPDFVEHCARVLRLRVLSTMHRAHIEYFAHAVGAPNVDVPERGFMVNKHMGRLQAMREHVKARLVNQDAQWTASSIYTRAEERDHGPERNLAYRVRITYPVESEDVRVTKTVPVYVARKLFGDRMCASAVSWLLGLPVHSEVLDSDDVEMAYVGLVALPCTADLATQLYRAVEYTRNV